MFFISPQKTANFLTTVSMSIQKKKISPNKSCLLVLHRQRLFLIHPQPTTVFLFITRQRIFFNCLQTTTVFNFSTDIGYFLSITWQRLFSLYIFPDKSCFLFLRRQQKCFTSFQITAIFFLSRQQYTSSTNMSWIKYLQNLKLFEVCENFQFLKSTNKGLGTSMLRAWTLNFI